MPELAEIHSYARNINEWATGILFDGITKNATGKGPDISLSCSGRFSVFAQARGKELKLSLMPEKSPDNPIYVTFRHGLVGIWKWTKISQIPKHTHIFFTSSSSQALCFVDSNRLGTWNLGDFDTKTRGPDPINEFNNFRTNILGNITRTNALNKQICEVLLDQKFFNGIGNYLRAEILFRSCINPHFNTRELFSSNPEAGNRLLSFCRAIPLEVFTLRLDKYGDAHEKAKFNDWLKIYGKGTFDTVKGRKIYYDPNQHLRTPEDVPIPLQPHQTQKKMQPVTQAVKQIKPRDYLMEPKEKSFKKLLLAISLLFQTNRISLEEKNWMKNSAFQGSNLVFCALEAFEADEMKDLDDFAENIHFMFSLASDPRDSNIFC